MRRDEHFAIAWRLTVASWLGCALLQVILYLRPSPYGGPFMLHWRTFIIRPLLYELLSVWLLALPFLLLWLVLYKRPPVSPRWRAAHYVLAGVMTLNLLFTAFDHELYRFLGIRLGPSFLRIYSHPETLGDSLFLNILRADRGGPFVTPLIVVAAPVLYLWWALRTIGYRLRTRPPIRFGPRPALAIMLLPLLTGAVAYSVAKAKFRLARMEPVTFAMVRDFAQSFEDETPPDDLPGMTRAWRAAWQAGTTDRNWRFPDPALPFYRVPSDPSAPKPAERWNIIIVQLESVRALETGHLRAAREPSPTPYLDSLAARPDAAVYTRALSFGPPSVNGRFATQCSITPSSRRFVTSHTHISLYCLPDALRRQGYRAEMFSAGDIDMDNSTIWVQRMYDVLWRYPEVGQVDREVFRRAATRIRTLGRQGPFIATLISASNHHPFRSPEPKLDIDGYDNVHQRIRNSVRYTDDVVRELIESLRGEPWFEHTLVLINGDHGYNLGEHDGVIGGYTLYRESVWTPFLIVGPHPRLPVGRHDEIVTMLDIAPTVADLIGLREANPWQGHSLLALKGERDVKFGFRDSLLAEEGPWSAVRDPHDGRTLLYRSEDWLQRKDLAPAYPGVAQRMLNEAERNRRFHDFLLHRGRIWRGDQRPPGSP